MFIGVIVILCNVCIIYNAYSNKDEYEFKQ